MYSQHLLPPSLTAVVGATGERISSPSIGAGGTVITRALLSMTTEGHT